MSLEQTAVIDLIAHDAATGEVVLTLVETRAWTGLDEQLFQLQEKLNAYLSFALDGEMAEAYPQFANRRLRLELRCAQPPDARTSQLIAAVRGQIAFQDIRFVVVPAGGLPPHTASCGPGCGCAR